jgi:Homeodomain-like domain
MAQTVCVLPPAEDRERLLAIVADRNRPLKHVRRAQIVLCSADRLPVQEVARRASASRPAVWRWQARYAQQGVEGLLRDRECQESCVRGRFTHHALTNLSSKMIANWVLASHHSRGGIFHVCATWRKTRYINLIAASSVGK